MLFDSVRFKEVGMSVVSIHVTKYRTPTRLILGIQSIQIWWKDHGVNQVNDIGKLTVD